MSLRVRLLLAIGIALAVLWSGAALWMVRDLDRSLQHTLDERLAMSARMVAGLLSQSGVDGAPVISAQGSLTVPGSRGMACQIRSLRGEVIATTRGSGQAPLLASVPGYRTTRVGDQQWRTYTLRTEGFDITTADRLDERAALRTRVALAAGVPFVIAAVGGLLALWFGAGRALAPLSTLQRTLARRDPDATEPIDGGRLPTELQPLIGALNGLLDRVARAIARERNFTNDAAHELRTPLTVIDTHLQVARLSATGPARQALTDAATGTTRMRNTLDQLLMLARVEGRASFDEGSGITAGTVVERAITLARNDAPERLAVTVAPADRLLAVPPELAVVALRNLVDNALRYSPAACRVELEVGTVAGGVVFRVLDQGPGLDPSEIGSATHRFWRGNTAQGGSGLGLALVEAIAQRFGGSLRLSPRDPVGLVTELVLPLEPADVA